MAYKVNKTKKTIISYRIEKDDNYADFLIDTKLDGGVKLSIESSWGELSYYWGAPGPNPVRFICGLDIGYVAKNFGCSRWYDQNATRDALFHEITQLDGDKENLLELAEKIDFSSLENLMHTFQGELWDWFETGPDIYYDIDPRFRKLWEVFWGVFVQHLEAGEL